MSSFIGFDESVPEKSKKKKSTNFDAMNGLFGMANVQSEILELPVSSLTPRKNHRWTPLTGAKETEVRESIREFGVIEPIVVRPKEDIAYEIEGDYEILAGNNRTRLSAELGKDTVPAIVKRGLTEEEAEHYVNHTNIHRDWSEMKHSERAAVIASEYSAQKKRNVRKEVLEEINSYLNDMEKLEESMAHGVLSPGATEGVRELANEHDLSKDTIARYIRVDSLADGLKEHLDNGVIAFKAAVQLSYLTMEEQEMLVSLLNSDNGFKCNEEKAKRLRQLRKEDKLTIATMSAVLAGSLKKKKQGPVKGYKVSGKVIQKYFHDEDDEQIGKIIEEALKLYFGEE